MKCPICKTGKIKLFQDAIVGCDIHEDKTINEVDEQIDYLDNKWIECTSCHETSDENDILADLYDTINF